MSGLLLGIASYRALAPLECQVDPEAFLKYLKDFEQLSGEATPQEVQTLMWLAIKKIT